MKILEFDFVAYPITHSRPTPRDGFSWIESEVGPLTLGVDQSRLWKPSSDGPCLALEMEDFDPTIAGTA